MRAYVFNDPALQRRAGQFVWLSIDTEKAQNAGFQEKYPVEAWPTLFVIDPDREAAALKWLGGANVDDLGKLLDDGALEMHRGGQAQGQALLADADALQAQGKVTESIARYREALAAGLPTEGDRAATSLLNLLQQSGDSAGCLQLARERLGTASSETYAAGYAATGLSCALELDEKAPGRAEAVSALESATRKALEYKSLNPDDRSSLYGSLIEARQAAKDEVGAKALGRDQLAFLEGEAAKARDPQARSVFDAHRVNAAIAAGEPARALPALEQSERDLPQDYNPPARIALIELELGKLPEALAANDRALAKVYGPRKLRVLQQRATILERMGDKPRARQALDDALAAFDALPKGQQNPRVRKSLASARAKLGGP